MGAFDDIAAAAAKGGKARCSCRTRTRDLKPKRDCKVCKGTGTLEACSWCKGAGFDASTQAACKRCEGRGCR